MKFFYSFLFSCALLISCGCNTRGQQGKKGNSSPPNNASDNKILAEKNVISNNANKDPFTGPIKINIPINGDESSFEERQALRKKLKWNDACNFDLEKKENSDAGRVWGTFWGSDKYLVQVFCDSLGAYNSNYLTYLFDTVTKEIVLLNYEYFEQDVDKRYKKVTTWKPIGFSTDSKTQSITLLNRYYGAAQCGWEAHYKIVDGKPVLKGMRAAWGCDPGTDYDKWPKLNLSALRKKARKTVRHTGDN